MKTITDFQKNAFTCLKSMGKNYGRIKPCHFLKCSFCSFLFMLMLLCLKSGYANSLHPTATPLFSVRKSGTHLCSKLCKLLKIDFKIYHLVFPKPFNAFMNHPTRKGILIIRDPRDVCVSGVGFRTNRWFSPEDYDGKIPIRLNKLELQKWNQSNFDEKLMIIIANEFPLPYSQVNYEYELALKAMETGRFFLIKFEDLVGSKGGGSDKKQYKTIKALLKFLGLKRSEKRIKYAQKHLFGDSPTFRKGQIGAWKKHFKPEHIALFKERMNHTLLEWGYEDHEDWDLDK